ncbi:MAG: hypothetical protein LBB61_10660 [Treponema sp.]|jgi:uncharacterized membrane protein YesL|nr:hypothetical protein [Treponema sp.]
MIGFLIKKTFFDLWDNLFKIVLVNIGFLAAAAIPIFIPPLIPIAALSIAVLVAGVLCCCMYLAAASFCLRRVSDYSFFGFHDFFAAFKKVWLSGFVLGAFVILVGIIITVVLPFYFRMTSPLGWGLGILLFWFLAASVLSFQFFLTIRSRMNNPIKVSLKKCFLVFFDNLGFCVFSFIHNLILLAISAFLAFMVPGPAGILLFLDEGFRLRLLKYDWLEAHPEAAGAGKRPKIPWDEILIDEREKTGTRSFKSFIFPWKD